MVPATGPALPVYPRLPVYPALPVYPSNTEVSIHSRFPTVSEVNTYPLETGTPRSGSVSDSLKNSYRSVGTSVDGVFLTLSESSFDIYYTTPVCSFDNFSSADAHTSNISGTSALTCNLSPNVPVGTRLNKLLPCTGI